MSPDWPSSENLQFLTVLHLTYQKEENVQQVVEPVAQPPKMWEKEEWKCCYRPDGHPDYKDDHEAHLKGGRRRHRLAYVEENSHKMSWEQNAVFIARPTLGNTNEFRSSRKYRLL